VLVLVLMPVLVTPYSRLGLALAVWDQSKEAIAGAILDPKQKRNRKGCVAIY
jgi:hypothetical protein